MKNIHKILNIILFALLLIPALVFAQETTYTTPTYTKVHGNQVENLELHNINSFYTNNGFETAIFYFKNIQGNFLDKDGFMVYYRPRRHGHILGSLSNNNLMQFNIGDDNNSKVLEISYKENTLMLRRYHRDGSSSGKSHYIDYELFDRMFYNRSPWNIFRDRTASNIFKIYITANFIWIEVIKENDGGVVKNTHSPVYWGIGNDDFGKFASCDSNHKSNIKLFRPNIDDGYNDEDIQVYTFKLSQLMKDLKKFTSGSYLTERRRREEAENPITRTSTSLEEEDSVAEAENPVAKVSLEEDDIINKAFNVYPNPVKDELFVTLSSNKNTKIELMDMQGRLLYKAEVNKKYEHTIPIKDLNINSEIIFVRETTDKGVNTKRVIIGQ